MTRNSENIYLDELSFHILYLLSLNSRLSIIEISKQTKQSRRKIETRINSLYDQKTIKPLLIVNDANYNKYTVLIKLKKFNDLSLKIAELTKHVKIKEGIGDYDLSVLIINKKEQFDTVLERVYVELGDSIDVLDIIKHDFEDTPGYALFNMYDIRSKNKLSLPNENFKIDTKDKKIIDTLLKNPLMSYVELYKKTNFSYSLLKQRITDLQKNNIIRFSIDPYYNKLGLEFHNMFVKINPLKKKEFEEHIANNKHIHWIKRGTGKWEYILSVCAEDVVEFIELVREIKTENEQIIADSGIFISKVHVQRRF